MRRYYFTNYEADDIMNDHYGNIRGARAKAQEYANKNNVTVAINDCETEDIVDIIYPDSILDEENEDTLDLTNSNCRGR